MATITIYVPDQEPVAYDLDGYEQLTVGRSEGADIILNHDSLSGSHAVLQNTDGSLSVSDLGSTNGTYVNGEQITEAVAVGEGSQITFGNVEAVISGGEAVVDESAGGSDFTASAGGSGYGAHAAELSDVSNQPDGFSNLSPIEKVEKKDTLATIAVLLGVVAILAAIAVAGIATTMSAG